MTAIVATPDLHAIASRVRARLEAHRDAFEITWRQSRPVSEKALAAVETKLGMTLPRPLRAFYTKNAGSLVLGWEMRRGHEERLGGDLGSSASGLLELVAPGDLARRLASHGVVQITNDGGGNGFALRPGDKRGTVLWFDHDPSDGEQVTSPGVGSFGAWFKAWARLGFGSFGDENERVIAFLRGGKLAPIADDDTPSPSKKKSAAKKKPFIEPPKHKEQVWAVAALPDGARGASASNDGMIHVFDLATGSRTAKLAAMSRVYALVAHPAGKLLVSGGHLGFQVWDLKTGRPTRASNPHAGGVLDMALTPDGKRLVTIGLGELACWDLTTGKRLCSIEDDAASVRIDSRGRAVTYGEKKLRVWNLRTRKCERTITHAKLPLAFTSRSLAVDLRTDTIVIVDPRPGLARWSTDGKCLAPPRTPGTALAYSTLTPDGRTLLMNGTAIGVTFEAWDVESGKRTKALMLDGRVGVASIAVTPDGRRAILGSVYGWVLVCELAAMT